MIDHRLVACQYRQRFSRQQCNRFPVTEISEDIAEYAPLLVLMTPILFELIQMCAVLISQR